MNRSRFVVDCDPVALRVGQPALTLLPLHSVDVPLRVGHLALRHHFGAPPLPPQQLPELLAVLFVMQRCFQLSRSC